MKDATVLVGRPYLDTDLTMRVPGSPHSRSFLNKQIDHSADVVQVLSTVLIMFQSCEDTNGSGSKTLHMSIEDLSAVLCSKYDPISVAEVSPILSPMAAEFRIMYATENQGSCVSQEFHLDCDSIHTCLTPDDVKIISGIFRKMTERIKLKESKSGEDSKRTAKLKRGKVDNNALPRQSQFFPMLQSKKKGSGIATHLRFEVQTFSFVLLRAQQFKYAGAPLFDFNLNQTKGRFEGCISAMSGELSAEASVIFFNTLISEWEYVVEPGLVVVAIEQLPSEFNLSVASPDVINMNLTGVLLSDLTEMEFAFFRAKHNNLKKKRVPSRLDYMPEISQVGTLDGASSTAATQPISFINESGVDIVICPMKFMNFEPSDDWDINSSSDAIHVERGSRVSLDSNFINGDCKKTSNIASSIAVGLSKSSELQLGKRKPILNLQMKSDIDHSIKLCKLIPSNRRQRETSSRKFDCASPETTISDFSATDHSRKSMYHYEPVVEWCIQNQRLRTSTVDIYSIEKGKDLLSSQMWSPGDEFYLDMGQVKDVDGLTGVIDGKDYLSFESEDDLSDNINSTRSRITGNWLRPYLKNDAPEWTDMTYILRLSRERVMLPDPNWIWVNDWTVDLNGEYGVTIDGDGWEYGVDFQEFNRSRRFYKRGDNVRRRRWTRTRIVKPPPLTDPLRPLQLVWETRRESDGSLLVRVRSPLTIHNQTSMTLSFFAFSYSWKNDQFIASIKPNESKSVPISLASATYIRLARKNIAHHDSDMQNEEIHSKYMMSERVMVLPTSFNSTVLHRTSIRWTENKTNSTSRNCLNFLIHVKCVGSITSLYVEPVLRIINLLPCHLQCKFGEMARSRKVENQDVSEEMNRHNIYEKEIISIDTSKDAKVLSVNPLIKPHLSLRLPGYKWSSWQRIVNRGKKTDTWVPSEEEEADIFQGNEGDIDHATEFKSIVRLDRLVDGGDPLVVIIGVQCGHCPTLRVWAQYWILDKTGFGLRFADEFTGILGNIPTGYSSRRSYFISSESNDEDIAKDLGLPGHQWSIGMSGMSLYFSKKEKIAFCIESGAGIDSGEKSQISSSWGSFMDISNVMPKTIFSLEEYGGPRRFELSLSVSLCPSVYSRTKLITIFPRYQIVNLLNETIFVAQDGCLKSETAIPSQTSVPFHLDVSSLAPCIRLSVAYDINRLVRGSFDGMWTNGCIRLDKIGITSMRLPTPKKTVNPMVIQAEVRLATPKQSSAVVIVIWSTNEASNPLYLLRNRSPYTILCSQQHDEEKTKVNDHVEHEGLSHENLSNKEYLTLNYKREMDGLEALRDTLQCRSNLFEIEENNEEKIKCSALDPLIGGLFMNDKEKEFIWRLPRDKVMCFGFEDPEKPHILKWACIDVKEMASDQKNKRFATLEVNGMGSSSILTLMDGRQVICQIKAEHSTKVIEFSELKHNLSVSSLSNRVDIVSEFATLLRDETEHEEDGEVDDDFIALKFRVDLLGVAISVVDNISEAISGREILYFQSDSWLIQFSQSREGYHEIELRLMSLQVDNHVARTAHPVLVRITCCV